MDLRHEWKHEINAADVLLLLTLMQPGAVILSAACILTMRRIRCFWKK